ncbi:MAG: hypothetical protein ACHQPH_12240 [Reyranellales bacterium]
MRANLGPSVDLDFLDGYLFRLIQEIAEKQGLELTGFYNYYDYRLRHRIGGLIEYEAELARFLLDGYAGRHIVHAGTGIGVLPCALACNGMSVTAVDGDTRRLRSAQHLRAVVAKTWPEVTARYRLLGGNFPNAMTEGRGWRGRRRVRVELDRRSVLVFTNVVTTWGDRLEAAIFAALPTFAETLLDLRNFGATREDANDRDVLFARIAAGARFAERLPSVSSSIDLARFVFAEPA